MIFTGFAMGSQKDICSGIKSGKFHITNSKLRKQHFIAKNMMGKCQISKSRGQGPSASLPTPMQDNCQGYTYNDNNVIVSNPNRIN